VINMLTKDGELSPCHEKDASTSAGSKQGELSLGG
jgi:hypothetical protein